MKGNKNLDSSCKKPQDITMNLLENIDDKKQTITLKNNPHSPE